MTTPAPHARTTRLVPLHQLRLEHPQWQNPRTMTGLSDDEIDEFGKELKARGILVPPEVQQVKWNGDILNLVTDGQRRVKAALKVFPKDYKIEVIDRTSEAIDLTPDQADQIMLEALATGQKREGLSSYELSEVAEYLRKRGQTLAQIGRAIGKSESWVSKILKARDSASPKTVLAWKKGEITDEQFKELASVKEHGKQAEAVKEIAAARASGDKTEARTRAKEIKEEATKPNGHKPAVTGEQQAMWKEPPPVKDKDEHKKADKPDPKVRSASKAELEGLLDLGKKRPPTHDFVKGIMAGARYALDPTTMEDWPNAWRQYVSRIEGKPAKKSKAKPKKAKPSKRKSKR